MITPRSSCCGYLRRGFAIALAAAAAGASALAVGGCGDSSYRLVIEVTDPDGAAPEPLVAVVGFSDAEIERIVCPGPATPRLTCDDRVIVVAVAPSHLEVTIKASGLAFAVADLDVAGLPARGGDRVAAIALAALPAFADQADYTTGFAADQIDRFRELAFAVDGELGPTEVVKFYLRNLDTAPELYFQNTRSHPLHYEFARNVLGVALSRAEFEDATYHGADRNAMAGTLILYPAARATSEAHGGQITAPLAVTFFPSDDLTPAQAVRAHQLLEERIGFAPLTGDDHRLVYLPAGTVQEDALAAARACFARRDALWLTRAELYGNVTLQILNPGLAYGTLKRLTPEQLETEVVSFTDVLLLPRLPNTLPIVGGTISEELQTPLAHVNVASRARGTPNLAYVDAASDPAITSLFGKLVRFEVVAGGFTLAETTLAEAQAFWDSRHPEPVIPGFDIDADGLPGFAALGFTDAIRVGAKAANLAELANLLGERAPHGFAVPFHYYDQFLITTTVDAAGCQRVEADCLAGDRAPVLCSQATTRCTTAATEGDTLSGYIDRLLDDAELAADSSLREAALAGLRCLIETSPVDSGFAALLDQRVTELFGTARVRLRSSTNAEDLPSFSGAGLYQSVSAYGSGAANQLASDQVRTVWASAWSWRAFEERSFWNIDHRAVRMGVAVNQAFTAERANGVLITQNIVDPVVAGIYVNVQLGEVSVTNPDSGALPEVFSIVPAPPSWIQVSRLRYSSLSPDQPILTDAEISALYQAAATVQEHFAPLYGVDPSILTLDLEFKFNGPERALFVKQVRPYLDTP